MSHKIWIANNDKQIMIDTKMLNRHGVIAGATGTGKTISLKVIIEALSDNGIPTFVTDIKGDVSGLATAGIDNKVVNERVEKFGISDFEYKGYPVAFWDIYGENGIPVRARVESMGAPMLAKLLNLNDTQTSVLTIVFKIAKDNKFEIVTLDDLRRILEWVNDRADTFSSEYGRLSEQTLSTIQRNLVFLDELGAEHFFGKPELNIEDWFLTDASGKGVINILDSVRLVNEPTLYAMFLIWMMSDLFEILPEVGDPEKPKIVLFFDEAHLLFRDMPKVLTDRIERVVKLIRSKGVGIFFITQTTSDIDAAVLGQMGNRIQHALRAYTPQDQKNINATADTFRTNDQFSTKDALLDLGTGEALVSFLDEKGTPSIVERAFILPPHSLMAQLDAETRNQLVRDNPYFRLYSEATHTAIVLPKKEEPVVETPKPTKAPKEVKPKATRKRKTSLEKGVDSAMNTLGREVGKSLMKGLQGLFKKK